MTARYVYSSSAQDDSDSTWNSSTVSYTTLDAALTAWAAGDIIYMAHDHDETTAGIINIGSSCVANNAEPAIIRRVNRSTGNYSGKTAPGTGTGYNISATGATGDVIAACSFIMQGVHIDVGDDFNCTNNDDTITYYQCTIDINDIWRLGTADCGVDFIDTDINSFGSLQLTTSRRIRFIGGSVSSTTTGTVFDHLNNNKNWLICEGVDFSGLGTGATLGSAGFTEGYNCLLNRCKLPTSYGTPSIASDGQFVEYWSTDDSADHYRAERHEYRGTVTPNTSTYLTAGYDFEGTTNLGMEMVPSSTCDDDNSLESQPIYFYYSGATGSSKTFTIEVLEDFTTSPTKYELWMELLYCGTSSSVEWVYATSRDLDGTSGGAALDSGVGTGSWTGATGFASKKVSVSVTPQVTGVYKAVVHLGKYEAAKSVVYNPQVTVT